MKLEAKRITAIAIAVTVSPKAADETNKGDVVPKMPIQWHVQELDKDYGSVLHEECSSADLLKSISYVCIVDLLSFRPLGASRGIYCSHQVNHGMVKNRHFDLSVFSPSPFQGLEISI